MATVSQHPLNTPRPPPLAPDAGITRPYLSRLTQDVVDDSVPDKKPVADGQERLVIVHKVCPKDSLPGVSLRYGIPLAELRRFNQLWASDPIHLRDVLYIPVDNISRTHSSPSPLQPCATIQRVPSSQLSFFPSSRPAHRTRRRRSLTDGRIPRSQPATLSRSHARSHSLLTTLSMAASTRNTIVPRLSFDSISSSFDDRSRSQSDIEENHELEEVVSRTRSKMPRNDQPRCISPPPSYIPPPASLSVIRTIQMEPSPIMQIPKRMNSTSIHDHVLKEGMTECFISRSKVYASAHDLNSRLLH